MRHALLLLGSIFLLITSARGQSLEYEFDPNYLSITRDKDTILHTTTGNMLSNINLRIQEPGETSFVAIRPRINGVQDNPGIVFVQADGTQALRLVTNFNSCLLYTSPSPRDRQKSRMPSSA